MKKQSVDVLDEADRFEDVLNWQLFAMEQTTRLFHGHAIDKHGDEVKWRPGDPILRRAFFVVPATIAHPELATNYGRRIFDLFEDDDGLDTDDTDDFGYVSGTCLECGVMWHNWPGEEVFCWMCGQLEFVYEYSKSAMGHFSQTMASALNSTSAAIETFAVSMQEATAAFREYASRDTLFTQQLLAEWDGSESYSVDIETYGFRGWHDTNSSFDARIMVDDHLSPAPSLGAPVWSNFTREEPTIVWPENVSMEPTIPLPDALFPEFVPPREALRILDDHITSRRRNRSG